jgi:hypothetical protein
MAWEDGDGTISVRSVAGSKKATNLKGFGIAFGPGGRTLVSGSKEGTVRLWNWTNKTSIAALAKHAKLAEVVGYSTDGGILASWGADNRIKIWDIASAKCKVTISRQFVSSRSVAVSPDGKTLAIASRAKILLWDLTAIPANRNGDLAEEHDLEATRFLDDDRDLVEQAFRHMIPGGTNSGSVYFLSLDSERPAQFTIDDAFIARFKDVRQALRKGSDWKAGAGTKLSVSLVRWISNTRVELAIEFYRSGREGSGYSCVFEFKNGRWQFEKGSKANEWVS